VKMESEEEPVVEYVQMNSTPSVRRVKAFSMEEILEMVVEELRNSRRQKTRHKGSSKPQLQKKLLTKSLGKEKSPRSSPKKEWLMRSRALELKMSREEERGIGNGL